jgi:hypothetical protein
MKDKTNSRETVLSEVLVNTNKPRFCYLGYAPPLCIGDDYDKPAVKPNPAIPDDKPAIRVPGKKTGSESLFATISPLCIGDPYIDRWKNFKDQQTDERPKFRPPGKSPDPPIIPYISHGTGVADRIKKKHTIVRGFLVPTTSGLFHKPLDCKKIAVSSAPVKARLTDSGKPPFRFSYGCSRSFDEYAGNVNDEKNFAPIPNERKEEHVSLNAFRPAGIAGIRTPFPEYLPQSPLPIEKASVDSDKPCWKPASVALLSSPTSSIAMNMTNLQRCM